MNQFKIGREFRRKNRTMEQDLNQIMSNMINSRFDASDYSENARKCEYRATALKEFLINTVNEKTYRKLAGSIVEPTYLPSSDVDTLMIDKCSTVGYNPQEATYSNKVYLRLTSGPLTRPGYTKLQLYRNGKPYKIDNKKPSHYHNVHIVNINERKCFLTNTIMHGFRLYFYNKPLYSEIHGPAKFSTFSGKTSDNVAAYESEIIPNETIPWFERYRRYNWPTKETLDLLKSMGCCYVGVGHLKSQEKHLEWRISLTRQELYLMLNLNSTQYRCYILLKVIKKELEGNECDDMLCSYHFKTALFYTIEVTEHEIWQPHNLFKCVLICLKLLLNWVKKRYCPNYFLPEENMFETKLIDNCKIQKLQVTLDTLICNYLGTCFEMLKYDNVFPSEKMVNLKSADLIKKILLSVGHIDERSLSDQRNKIMAIYDKVKCPTEQNNLEEIKMLRPCEPDYDVLVKVLKIRLIHLERVEHFLSVMMKRMTINRYLDIHKDFTESLPEDFQYRLKLASIASAQMDYVICDELLQKSRHIAYRTRVICQCDFRLLLKGTLFRKMDKTTNALNQNLASAGNCLNSMSIIDILQQFTLCLNFIESELEGGIVMAPLHLEAYKTVGKPLSKMFFSDGKDFVNDLMSVHPITYIYFLQYKNSEMMEKKCDMCVALEKLENMNLVSLCEGIYSHPDIILNVLGHIYITKGWYGLAIECFNRSWELLPDYNSAKWHIMFLLFGCPKQASKM